MECSEAEELADLNGGLESRMRRDDEKQARKMSASADSHVYDGEDFF